MKYSLAEAARLAGTSPARVRSWVKAGVLAPPKDTRGRMRFDFRSIVILRAAAALGQSLGRVPLATLRSLAQALPERSLAGVLIRAEGHTVVVEAAGSVFEAKSGQVLFDFRSAANDSEVEALLFPERTPPPPPSEPWARALWLEQQGRADEARAFYRQVLVESPGHLGATLRLAPLVDATEAEALKRAAELAFGGSQSTNQPGRPS